MEIINDNKSNKPQNNGSNGQIAAIILILIGLLFLGRNLGFIGSYLFHIFISWQMLLVAIGIWSVIRRQFFSGTILIAIGAFFMIPRLVNVGYNWIHTYWPIILIFLGLIILFSKKKIGHNKKNHPNKNVSHQSDDGFLNSSILFGGIRHIILDPVFKGAIVKNSFGGTVIDLRKTTLGSYETFIDIDCVFGGIEIYVPGNWQITTEDVKTVFAACEDKRHQVSEKIDYEHKLILRGSICFSGVEIKS